MERKCNGIQQGKVSFCDLSLLRRTVWSGDHELVEIQRPVAGTWMPGLPGDTATLSMMESDTTTLSLPSTAPNYQIHYDPNPQFGRVAYVRGVEVDRPLSFTRFGYVDHNSPVNNCSSTFYQWPKFTLVPHWNARGEAATGTFANGAARYRVTLNGCTREVGVVWPKGELAFNRAGSIDSAFVPWQGTLLDQKMDGVGTLYRRNRQYDPATGRFTL